MITLFLLFMSKCNLLWIASFPDGAYHHRKDGPLVRHRLPADTWLCDRLLSHGEEARSLLRAGNPITLPRSHAQGFLLHGLAKISSVDCTHNVGILTHWHKESSAQRDHYGLPLDDYEVRIEDVAPCSLQAPLFWRKSDKYGKGGMQKLNTTSQCFQPLFDPDASTVELHHKDLLADRI